MNEKCLTQSYLGQRCHKFLQRRFSQNTSELFKEIGVEPLNKRSRPVFTIRSKTLPEAKSKEEIKRQAIQACLRLLVQN